MPAPNPATPGLPPAAKAASPRPARPTPAPALSVDTRPHPPSLAPQADAADFTPRTAHSLTPDAASPRSAGSLPSASAASSSSGTGAGASHRRKSPADRDYVLGPTPTAPRPTPSSLTASPIPADPPSAPALPPRRVSADRPASLLARLRSPPATSPNVITAAPATVSPLTLFDGDDAASLPLPSCCVTAADAAAWLRERLAAAGARVLGGPAASAVVEAPPPSLHAPWLCEPVAEAATPSVPPWVADGLGGGGASSTDEELMAAIGADLAEAGGPRAAAALRVWLVPPESSAGAAALGESVDAQAKWRVCVVTTADVQGGDGWTQAALRRWLMRLVGGA
ncbi:hypothetical protein HK405_004164 [Cladochytrium tenue]|nr:hypothetical protein HK405_004164 [Cladochytrium tenue]